MNESYSTPSLTMPAFWAASERLPRAEVELLPPRSTPTRLLSPVEKATIKVSLTDDDWPPLGRGILHDAAARLWIFRQRGLLEHLSGQHLANNFQWVFWPSHPTRRSLRGFDLLRALDQSDLPVEVELSSLSPDGMRYRRMRLHERVAELSH